MNELHKKVESKNFINKFTDPKLQDQNSPKKKSLSPQKAHKNAAATQRR